MPTTTAAQSLGLGLLPSQKEPTQGVQFTVKIRVLLLFKPAYPPVKLVGPAHGPGLVLGEEGMQIPVAPPVAVLAETVWFNCRCSQWDQLPSSGREAEVQVVLQKYLNEQRESGQPVILQLEMGGIPAIWEQQIYSNTKA